MSAAAVELGAPVPLERSSRVEEIEEKEVEDLTEIVDNMKIAETAPDPEKVMKHPLQNAWTLWFFKNDKTRSWEENQRPIITVTTVEDFWSLYNHIEVASRLPPGSDYSLFKEGIFPDWEDKRNAPGGRWMINVDKRQRAECLDTYWLEILFFLIGEHADQHAHQVNFPHLNAAVTQHFEFITYSKRTVQRTPLERTDIIQTNKGDILWSQHNLHQFATQ